MRTDKNLDMHYLRIIKNGGGHEYLNTIVLRKSDEKIMYMGGRVDYESYGSAAGEYKGLLMQCNLDNWGLGRNEIGSFDFVANDNI